MAYPDQHSLRESLASIWMASADLRPKPAHDGVEPVVASDLVVEGD